jgi:hypothetical protein
VCANVALLSVTKAAAFLDLILEDERNIICKALLVERRGCVPHICTMCIAGIKPELSEPPPASRPLASYLPTQSASSPAPCFLLLLASIAALLR